MDRVDKPEDALMKMVKTTLHLAWSFICLLLLTIILLGKMFFDFLYEVTGIEERRTGRKRVECEVRPPTRSS